MHVVTPLFLVIVIFFGCSSLSIKDFVSHTPVSSTCLQFVHHLLLLLAKILNIIFSNLPEKISRVG